MSALHATCVNVGDMGVLLLGPSGSGKSDLALRLIGHGGCGGRLCEGVLVADDQVIVTSTDGRLTARAPQNLKGRLEIRGIGVVSMPYLETTDIQLAATLSTAGGDRIPDFTRQVIEIAGIAIPNLALNPFEASAPAKIRAMVQAMAEEGFANQVRTKEDG